MVLATIITSLGNFLKLPESDISLLDVMGGGDEQHNVEDDKVAATEPGRDASGTSTPSTTGDQRVLLPTASSSRLPAKKKVAESWEDEDEDADDEVGASEESNEFDEFDGSEDEEDEDEDFRKDRSVEEIEQGFMSIHQAFVKLRAEFDTKFKAIFA